MNTGFKGARAELAAACWLMQQGYYAFINAAPNGPVDLIALHADTREMILVEVRSSRIYYTVNGAPRSYTSSKLTDRQRSMNVRMLFFNPESGEFLWMDELPPRERKTGICERCNASFESTNFGSEQRFCSKLCQERAAQKRIRERKKERQASTSLVPFTGHVP